MASRRVDLMSLDQLGLDPITKESLKQLVVWCNLENAEVICYTYDRGRPMFQLQKNDKRSKLFNLVDKELQLVYSAVKLVYLWKNEGTVPEEFRPIDDAGIRSELEELRDLAESINGEFTWNEDGSKAAYGRPVELSWNSAYDKKWPHKGPSCQFRIPDQIGKARKFIQHDSDLMDE